MKKVSFIMEVITKEDILSYEKSYRTHFMNSLNGYKSANLIGTKDKAGQSNLAIFSSVIHMGSNPPLLGFITRPDTVSRHTLENIRETGIYTINHINTDIVEQAHQTSARYEKDVSEFEESGLNSQYINDFKAPFVTESLIGVGMRIKEIIPIPSNGTLLVVGEVQLVSYSDECVLEDGKIDLVKAKTAAISGLDTYHSTEQITRLSYAKAGKKLKRI
ncbi:MAG: flavin reductase (DIM6/NTAB) family NADH-FMN oxidoreductase RutF [Maribacter sp.]|jgi:flavin reductase (DIM6/NTAB) family NADH-FMN oxidoreductase RutF